MLDPKESGLKLTHLLLVLVVFGASTTQACLAKASRHAAKADSPAAASVNAGANAAKGARPGAADTGAGGKGAGSKDNGTAGNPIDTRIAEPRGGPINK